MTAHRIFLAKEAAAAGSVRSTQLEQEEGWRRPGQDSQPGEPGSAGKAREDPGPHPKVLPWHCIARY